MEEQIQQLHAIAEAVRAGRKDKGSIMLYGEEGVFEPVEVIPTGSFLLNEALGVQGFPKGRIVELYGNEGSGKSSIALSAIAEAQKQGVLCLFMDAENALLAEWAENLNVDMRLLLVSQQSCTQDVFDTIDRCIDQGVGLVVIDSIAGLCPREELEGDFGDHHVGLQARWMGQALRKLSEKIRQTKTAAIFINQIRMKVGVMFGNPETTPGGRALKFYSSIRIEVKQRAKIKDGSDIVGVRMGINVPKNKVALPFKKCEIDFYFDRGYDVESEYFDYVQANTDTFTKKGTAHFLWPEVSEKSKTRKGWLDFLRENPNVLKQLIDKANGT